MTCFWANIIVRSMNLEEYARISGRSLSTFKRHFKQMFGTSPGRCLTGKRLEQARYLIEQTGKSISEVVLDSEFKNTEKAPERIIPNLIRFVFYVAWLTFENGLLRSNDPSHPF